MSELLEYKCPNCGGVLHFDAQSQKLKCLSCSTEFDVEAAEEYNNAQAVNQDDLSWLYESDSTYKDQNLAVYVCQSCGGEVVQDKTTAASSCPFCGNAIIVTSEVSGELRPDLVIPFKVTKEDAKNAYRKHVQAQKLVPAIFKRRDHIDEIKGVYVPFWLFSSDVAADVRYRAQRTRSYSDGNYRYVETSHFLLKRRGRIAFDDVPVEGSTKISPVLMESIEPFDVSEGVDFETAYLSGYLANRYDIGKEESIGRANERIKNSTESAFRDTTAGYGMVTTVSSHLTNTDGKARYALLPVWLLSTVWGGKTYQFAMNGQTGKFVGDLPEDKMLTLWLFLRTFVIVFLIMAIVLVVIFMTAR
ncbi:MAG: hypothetical protein Q4F09_03280 [Erysipelotrichaceae bacterium]|nr:hypothetical protein [Erysipelotrichaceae bacterium]